MRSASMIIWAVVLVLVVAGSSRADLVGYVVRTIENDQVYFTNFDTGEQTLLGRHRLPEVEALEFSPIDGRLYATGADSLWTIDTTSGAGSKIGSVGTTLMHNLAFAPGGTLYGIAALEAGEPGENESWLMTIDTGTGGTTVIGSRLPYERVWGFAIDETGRAVATGENVGSPRPPSWLFEIDLTDGSTSPLGEFPAFRDLDYGPNGILYAWADSGMGGEYLDYFYSIDVENLEFTHLRTFRLGQSQFAIIPEPATLLMLGMGAVVLRRKRRA